MTVGDAVQGVIVLSSLGYGAFDEEDQRLLEVLASHAAIAISNAKLLQAEREAAETSTALLGLSKQLTQLRSVGDILQGSIETVSSLIGAAAVAFHVRDEHTGDLRLARLLTVDAGATRPDPRSATCPSRSPRRSSSRTTSPWSSAARHRWRATRTIAFPRNPARCSSRRCGGSRTVPARSRSSAGTATGCSAIAISA